MRQFSISGLRSRLHNYFFEKPPTSEFGVIRDSTITSTNDFQVFAETFSNVSSQGFFVANGGLCAPLTPLYTSYDTTSPVKNVLPSFTITGGAGCITSVTYGEKKKPQ